MTGEPTSLGHRLGISATQLPAWVLQAIAAFPLRDQATHTAVYVCYLALFLVVVSLGLRYGTARSRIAIALVAATMLLLPYAMTVKSFDAYGAAWQGRYGLPVAIGMVLLAACGARPCGARPSRPDPDGALPPLRGRADVRPGSHPPA